MSIFSSKKLLPWYNLLPTTFGDKINRKNVNKSRKERLGEIL